MHLGSSETGCNFSASPHRSTTGSYKLKPSLTPAARALSTTRKPRDSFEETQPSPRHVAALLQSRTRKKKYHHTFALVACFRSRAVPWRSSRSRSPSRARPRRSPPRSLCAPSQPPPPRTSTRSRRRRAAAPAGGERWAVAAVEAAGLRFPRRRNRPVAPAPPDAMEGGRGWGCRPSRSCRRFSLGIRRRSARRRRGSRRSSSPPSTRSTAAPTPRRRTRSASIRLFSNWRR